MEHSYLFTSRAPVPCFIRVRASHGCPSRLQSSRIGDALTSARMRHLGHHS